MIEHIVVFKLKADVPAEQITKILNGIMNFKHQIPGILDVTCGTNYSSISKGYTHGAVLRFVDKAALEEYFSHPAHVELVEKLLKPVLEDGLEIDYEIGAINS